MDTIRKLFARKNGDGKKEQLWVTGSGLVYVPEGRLSEIPRVIAEYHLHEAERARLVASIRRA
jgi:hypothetical protein